MASREWNGSTGRCGFRRFVRRSHADWGLALALAPTLLLAACSLGGLGGAEGKRSATVTSKVAATQTPLPQITPPHSLAQMAYDSRSGAIVLFGGVVPEGAPAAASEATWVWAGAGWHEVRTASAPDNTTRNSGSTLTYDSTHDQIIFFEYVSLGAGAFMPQTWTFDGSNWTRHAVSPGAPPLTALLADDPAGGGVLAFGGITGYTNGGKQPVYSTVTWRWDGAHWTQLRPAASPAAADAQFAAMTTDTDSRQVALVNQRTGEVWTWNGTTWAAHQPTVAPPARDSAVLVFDGKSQSLVLVNGYVDTTGHPMGDMWQWKGSAWSPLSVTGTPTSIESESVIYDAQMQALVAYVGQQSPPESQTWIWDGGSAWRELG